VFFQQFYLQSLGHASYLVGDEKTGQAMVFDPGRDVEVYLRAAREQGLRIAYAADSHGHNDYLSGLSELTARTDAQLWGSAVGELGYAHRPLKDREVIEVGDVGVEVLHTPGHTPEHISLLVYDRTASADTPALMLSGGALLVGDLARPDLLGGPEQARQAAQVFCDTIQTKLLSLPDHVEVFPTHVAGSLCGGNIGSRLSTTVGFERRTNAVLAEVDSTEGFVRECIRLDNLPAVPPYWRRMRAQNLAGVAPLGVLGEPPALTVAEFAERQAAGALVLDTRSPEAFGGGHIPGALNVGLGAAFATWAGTVLPDRAQVLLVLDRPEDLWEASWQLLRVGYPAPAGWLRGGITAWRTQARPVQATPQITVHELKQRLDRGEIDLLDVRQPDEWHRGHVSGARWITGAELPDRIDALVDDLPAGRPIAVTCGSGYRSSVAASLLAHRGLSDVINVTGGMTAWNNADYSVER
jgi:hydroxyacylglutathione hydrolase